MTFTTVRDTPAIDPNADADARPPRRTWFLLPRVGLVAGSFATLALLLSACGGGKRPTPVASLGPTTTTTPTTPSSAATSGGGAGAPGSQSSAGGPSRGRFSMNIGGSVQALTKYSDCMRKNGVPSFPDPNAQGEISFSSASGVDPGSPQFQKAQQTCQKLLPNGGQPTPAQEALARSNALAFSACMRSHGVPSFPDPQFGTGGRVSIRIKAGTGLDPGSPQFQAAQTACQKDLPGSGPGKTAGSGAKG